MLSLLSSDDEEIAESKDRLETVHDEGRKDFLNATFRLKDFFKICLDLGVRLIMVTDGSNGVYAATKDKIYHSEWLRIKNVLNTLGAGDAFSSTFCANIYKGNSVEDSIKFALINASHVIQYSDAKSGLQTSESLERIKSKKNCGLDKKITVTPW